jgi:hypothetical protein
VQQTVIGAVIGIVIILGIGIHIAPWTPFGPDSTDQHSPPSTLIRFAAREYLWPGFVD